LEKGLLGSQSNPQGISDVLGTTMNDRNALWFSGDNDSANLRQGTFTDDDENSGFWINNEGKLELRPK
jgi:hypothetical protein